jgi:hypothetical protein
LFWTKITGGLIIGWPLSLIFILNSFLKDNDRWWWQIDTSRFW